MHSGILGAVSNVLFIFRDASSIDLNVIVIPLLIDLEDGRDGAKLLHTPLYGNGPTRYILTTS